jgi:hypothetical protein
MADWGYGGARAVPRTLCPQNRERVLERVAGWMPEPNRRRKTVDLTPRKRSMRPGRWGVTAGVALIALGMLSINAFATFTAAQSVNHAVTTGSMAVTVGAGNEHTIATGASNIVPGDTIWRTIRLNIDNNAGTMAGMTLTTTCAGAACDGAGGGGSDDQEFAADTSLGIKVWIQACTQAYPNIAAPGVVADCAGGSQANVLGTTGVPVAFEQSNVDVTSALDLTDNAANYLRVRITWPSGAAGAHNAMMDESATLRFTFTGTQRAGTNK